MIQELHAGDRQIPASGWNEMRAAVQGITPGQQQYNSSQRNPVYITVKNVTGSDLPAFSVVKLSGAIYSRTGDTFVNQAISNGVELNGYTPTSAADPIAVIQADCPAGEFVKAIVSGATACKVYKASNVNYKYASVTAGQSGYLTGSDDVTGVRVLWIATGTGNKEAYVLLDNVGAPEQEYFLINPGNDGTGTQVNDPSVYTVGSLHYVTYSSTYNAWIPFSQNEGTPATTAHRRYPGTKLVVCQRDAPSGSAEYKMPYYTPESNIGVPPKFASSVTIDGKNRCGVLMGEHEFTGRMWDYGIEANSGPDNSATFFYQPQFLAYLEATGQTGGGNTVYVEINNVQYPVQLAYGGLATGGLSAPNYPDVYPYDIILVEIDCQAQNALPIWIPTDYEALTIMAFYTSPGRGWDAMQTPQGMADAGLTLYIKVKTGAIT